MIMFIKIMGAIVYVMMAYFTVLAYRKLKSLSEETEYVTSRVSALFAFARAEHLCRMFEQIRDMEAAIRKYVDDERFEDAEQMSKLVARLNARAKEELEDYKKTYGDMVDIITIQGDGRRESL